SRLSGAGLLANTRPARSNVEPWQGQSQPPGQSLGRPGWAPVWKWAVGEQPRWVQMPMQTKYSGLRERYSFFAHSGVKPGRSELGSASSASCLDSASTSAFVRRTIQTGLPRHSTVIIWPSARPEMSASTGAPAALAFSEGANEPTKGTAVATPATPPSVQADATQKRREGSGGLRPARRTVSDADSFCYPWLPPGGGAFFEYDLPVRGGWKRSPHKVLQPRIIALRPVG